MSLDSDLRRLAATLQSQAAAADTATAATVRQEAQRGIDGREPALGNPAADNYILSSNTAGVRLWVPRTSTATPQPLGTAAAGTTGVASDAGHVHAMPTATQVGAVPTTGGTFTGAVSVPTPLTVGTGTGLAQILFDGGAGNVRDLVFFSGGVQRWLVRATAEAETGSNAGSNLAIGANADDGSSLGNAFAIIRATRYVGILTRLGVGNVAPAYSIDSSGDINARTGQVYRVNGTQVVAARRTGWTAATGTATRTTFATSTVTTAQLAERVKALIDDLLAHGLLGA